MNTNFLKTAAAGMLLAATGFAAEQAGGMPIPGSAGASTGVAAVELAAAKPVCASEVTATGRVLPLYSARIGSRLSAQVVSWGAGEGGKPLDVGMRVTAGQTLFAVESDTFRAKVAVAEASLASAAAQVPDLEARLQDRLGDEARYQRLVEVDKTVPLKKLEEVRLGVETLRQQIKAAKAQVQGAQAARDAARLDLRDTEVKAPFDGVITKRMKGLGDHLAGAPLVEVLELTTTDRLEAELRLPESYLAQVVPGTTVVALSSPMLQAELALPVTRVVPLVDAVTGTFAVRVAIPAEKAGGLVPGNFLTGRLQLAARDTGVIVPLRAVIRDAAGAAVMVSENGKLVRRAVELGSELTEGVVVKNGLKPGEQVAARPEKAE
jgi:RND family efflux transporter MFP subunit